MNFNFGFFAKTIKIAYTHSQYDLVCDLLICDIDQFKGSVDEGDASKYFRNRKTIPKQFVNHSKTPAGKAKIISFFTNRLIPNRIAEGSISTIIDTLDNCLKLDKSINKLEKNTVLERDPEVNAAEHLARLYLLALNQPNVYKNSFVNTTSNTLSVIQKVEIRDRKLFVDGDEISVPSTIVPPKSITVDKQKYVYELLMAYAEDNGVDTFTIETIPIKYSEHFNRHRAAYYHAETIRRRVRDIIPKEFELLMNDIYDGIVDISELNYDNSYMRLSKVFIHLTTIKTNKSKLENLDGWISIKERQGICHILVNEGKITWKK